MFLTLFFLLVSQLKAKEMYDAAITWSLELIEDYRIRIGKQRPFDAGADEPIQGADFHIHHLKKK